jgi:hypothetical protein
MSDLTVQALVRNVGSSKWEKISVTFTLDKMVEFSDRKYQMLRYLGSGANAGAEGDRGPINWWCRTGILQSIVPKKNRLDIIVNPNPNKKIKEEEKIIARGMSIGFSFDNLNDYQKVKSFLYNLNIREPDVSLWGKKDCNNTTAKLGPNEINEINEINERKKNYIGGKKKRKSLKKKRKTKKRKSIRRKKAKKTKKH